MRSSLAPGRPASRPPPPTPAVFYPPETPIGSLRPTFDGFSLADASWAEEPPTPLPTRPAATKTEEEVGNIENPAIGLDATATPSGAPTSALKSSNASNAATPAENPVNPLQLSRPKLRTTIALGPGGRTLTRAERATIAMGGEAISAVQAVSLPAEVKPPAASTARNVTPRRRRTTQHAAPPADRVEQPAEPKEVLCSFTLPSPSRPTTSEAGMRSANAPRRYASPALSDTTAADKSVDSIQARPPMLPSPLARSISTLEASTPTFPPATRDTIIQSQRPETVTPSTTSASADTAGGPSASSLLESSGNKLDDVTAPGVATTASPDLTVPASAAVPNLPADGATPTATLRRTPRKRPAVSYAPSPRQPLSARKTVPRDSPRTASSATTNLSKKTHGSSRGLSAKPPTRTRPQPHIRSAATSSATAAPARTVMKKQASRVDETQSTASTSRAPPTTSSAFAAAALAKLPPPSSFVKSSASIRDEERARDLAVRRAMFERLGRPQSPPPKPSKIRALELTVPGNVPFAKTRKRAQESAVFRADVAQREAQRAADLAEQERVRAEVEAEMDRRARLATVHRPAPLPGMYKRRRAED